MQIAPKLQIVIDQTISRIKVETDFLRIYAKTEANSESENGEVKIKGDVSFGQGKKKITGEKIIGTVPIYQVESILVLGSNHNIPARLVKLAAKHRISIHFCSSLNKYYGSLEFITNKKIYNRVSQYKACLNNRTKLNMAKQLVFQKILTQAKLCKTWDNYSMKEMLLANLKQIKTASSLEELRGIEGMASVLYWSAFGVKARESGFRWEGRKKHPSHDLLILVLVWVMGY